MSSAFSVFLQRTSSISSQLSTLSSPLTSSDGGEFRIYGRYAHMIMSNWKCDPTAVAMAMAVCNHLALQTAIAASE